MVIQLYEYESTRQSGKTQKESENTRLNTENTVKSLISGTLSNQRVNAFNYNKLYYYINKEYRGYVKVARCEGRERGDRVTRKLCFAL